jgi:hypothetical protein
MPVKKRVKITAAFSAFNREIERLEKFDLTNQHRFNAKQLTKPQLELLVESIFFAAFRNYEGFIREVFILYTLEKQGSKKPKVKSYLKPNNFEHAELLIKSSMPFLDWTSPDTVIERAELFLQNGHPIKLPYSTNLQQLKDFKKLRNHIAHNSMESEVQFEKLVRTYFHGVKPLVMPTPGQYLMFSSRRTPTNYLLLDFFDLMKQISIDLT